MQVCLGLNRVQILWGNALHLFWDLKSHTLLPVKGSLFTRSWAGEGRRWNEGQTYLGPCPYHFWPSLSKSHKPESGQWSRQNRPPTQAEVQWKCALLLHTSTSGLLTGAWPTSSNCRQRKFSSFLMLEPTWMQRLDQARGGDLAWEVWLGLEVHAHFFLSSASVYSPIPFISIFIMTTLPIHGMLHPSLRSCTLNICSLRLWLESFLDAPHMCIYVCILYWSFTSLLE